MFNIQNKYEGAGVYRFLNSEARTIYIGKSKNVHRRLFSQHFKKNKVYGHLPAECYKSTCKIEIIKCKDHAQAVAMEQYLIDKYIPKYLDSWRIDVIFEIDMYNYTHSYVEKSFKFKKDDVVIKNGMIVGFNFYGAFVSLLNADKRMNPPEAVVDMMGEPSCRYYRYNVVMKLTKK